MRFLQCSAVQDAGAVVKIREQCHFPGGLLELRVMLMATYIP